MFKLRQFLIRHYLFQISPFGSFLCYVERQILKKQFCLNSLNGRRRKHERIVELNHLYGLLERNVSLFKKTAFLCSFIFIRSVFSRTGIRNSSGVWFQKIEVCKLRKFCEHILMRRHALGSTNNATKSSSNRWVAEYISSLRAVKIYLHAKFRACSSKIERVMVMGYRRLRLHLLWPTYL